MSNRRRRLPRLPSVGPLLKGHFFTGLLVVIPLGVIAWISASVLATLWSLQEWLPDSLRPAAYISDPWLAEILNGLLTLALALLLALGVSILGWASKHYFGRKILEIIAFVIQRIPVLRSIYSALDQLLKTLATGSGNQFSRVVYVEYPRKGIWSLAFVTGPARGAHAPPGHLNLFVPTTPNPTSGFYFLVPESDVRESGLRVDEAFRTIISLGIVQSEQPKP